MPKATKFNVNVEEDQHVQEEAQNSETNSAPASIPSLQGPNPNITYLPINVGMLTELLPSHFFKDPDYTIVGSNFTDGLIVGTIMGTGSIVIGDKPSLALYVRGNFAPSHKSISLKSFKSLLNTYRDDARMVAIISNEEIAAVVGLRVLKGSSMFDSGFGIAITLGSRSALSDVRA